MDILGLNDTLGLEDSDGLVDTDGFIEGTELGLSEGDLSVQ